MNDQLYRKVGRKYVPVQEWPIEMPVDGVYLVHSDGGMHGWRRLLKLGDPAPVHALNYTQHIEDLAQYIVDQSNDCGRFSADLCAKWACEFFAEVAEE